MSTPSVSSSEFAKATSHAKEQGKSRSFYDLSHHHYHTDTYGEVTPVLHMEVVADDSIVLGRVDKTRSLSLSAPQFSELYEQTDYFAVPMEAILPFNWSKVFTNPITGDDVDSNTVNCILDANFPDAISTPFNFAYSEGDNYIQHVFLQNLLAVLIRNMYLSRSSLCSRLGYNFSSMVKSITFNGKTYYSWDTFADAFFQLLLDKGMFSNVSDEQFKATPVVSYLTTGLGIGVNGGTKENDVVLRGTSRLSLMRDFVRTFTNSEILNTEITVTAGLSVYGLSETAMKEIVTLLNAVKMNIYTHSKLIVNMSSLAAYQICCAHYFTQDRIDYVYSAELYRQMMLSFAQKVTNEISFPYNGVPSLFDALSGNYISQCFARLNITASNIYIGEAFVCAYAYIQNLFGMKRSLRFVDKFVNARKTPFALGATDIEVGTSGVSVVDIATGIQRARYLNLVNKIGRKFEEYTGKLFGTYVAPDFHNPSYLGRFRNLSSIYETENTGANQMTDANSITSRFNSYSDDKGIHAEFDRPSIVIGVKSYDMNRAYIDWLDRCHLHSNRFDYFMPQLQHIGDQPIYLAEMGLSQNEDEYKVFGYEVRNAEYKTRVSYASGGFLDYLKNWLLTYHGVQVESVTQNGVEVSLPNVISSDFIRSIPSEMDQFFISLTGTTETSAFHFIVDSFNIVKANRPIIVNPQFLQ